MPFLNITLITGYEEADRLRLSERLTNATVSVINAPADLVTVVINEVEPTNYMRGGVGRTPGPAQPEASNIVRNYLSAMEQRNLKSAAQYLSNEFSMSFPGDVSFSTLEELVNWSKSRYQSIGKTYHQFDECYCLDEAGRGETIVYCYGVLHGVWLDGSEFNSIRFIDRFKVKDSKICSQLVWNDMAIPVSVD